MNKNKNIGFNQWLVNNGFEKESKKRYTLKRLYLYELYLEEIRMKTLNEKQYSSLAKANSQIYYRHQDVKKHLKEFYNDYWKESFESDKCKKHITCDELDFLLNKHFGTLIKIKTLQDLTNK